MEHEKLDFEVWIRDLLDENKVLKKISDEEEIRVDLGQKMNQFVAENQQLIDKNMRLKESSERVQEIDEALVQAIVRQGFIEKLLPECPDIIKQ